jgi:hypothetical protein
MTDIDEMELLTRLRGEVPVAETTPDARHAFRARLTGAPGGSRARRPQWYGPSASIARRTIAPRTSIGRGPIMAGAAAVAVGLTAGIVALALPSGGHPAITSAAGQASSTGAPAPSGGVSAAESPSPGASTALTAQLLADFAAKAALAQPAVKPTQWVYRKIELHRQPLPSFIHAKFHYRTVVVENAWRKADGAGFYTTGTFWEDAGSDVSYQQTGSLPTNPAALDAYLAHLEYPNPNATTANKATAEFSDIGDMLTSYMLPPKLTAELYHALADIPTVIAKPSVKDIGGQSGPAFVLPQNSQSVNQEIILSPASYQLLATADWETGGHWVQQPGGGWSGPVLSTETAVLKQAFVSGSGKLP